MWAAAVKSITCLAKKPGKPEARGGPAQRGSQTPTCPPLLYSAQAWPDTRAQETGALLARTRGWRTLLSTYQKQEDEFPITTSVRNKEPANIDAPGQACRHDGPVCHFVVRSVPRLPEPRWCNRAATLSPGRTGTRKPETEVKEKDAARVPFHM